MAENPQSDNPPKKPKRPKDPADSPPGSLMRNSDRLAAADAQAYRDAQNGSGGEVNEASLAAMFTAEHQDHWRYVAAWSQWLHWTGVKWEHERTLLAFDQARKICQRVAATLRAAGAKSTKEILKGSTVASVERLARADRAHAVTADVWDPSLWHLNTPGGVVDLRSGQMASHDPSMMITKETAVSPSGQCQRWLQFLGEITDNDVDLQDYLQRVVGYCLTGLTIEHAMFFLYGTGANGKSVFTSTLSGIFGEFTTVAPMDMLIATQGERHPTDMAGLRGARMVTAIETEQGTRWAEAKLKALTGGDPISARFMRQDFFQYVPQFKLMIAGNHKPSMRSQDEAMRRRVQLIPFAVTIPEAQRELDLVDKLKAEWPGILQWAIVGCQMWQALGLKPPGIVQKATEDYFLDEDAVGRWIADDCMIGVSYSVVFSSLYKSWKVWAEDNGEFVMSSKALSKALRDRFKCQSARSNGIVFMRGIKLGNDDQVREVSDALL
jgi:P4 family phage/plasmid primase-like protien